MGLAPNWEGVNQNLNDLGTQLRSYYNQKKAKEDAIQAILDQGRAKQQVTEMDPMYQIKLKMIQDYFGQQGQPTTLDSSSPEGIVGVDTGAGPNLGSRLQPTIAMGRGEPTIKFGSLGSSLGERKFQAVQNDKAIQQEKESTFIRDSALDTLNTIKAVKEGINNFGATGPLWSTPWDYKRKKWESNINKLLSAKIVELITQMKSASKTGATGFGQLSDREGQILRQASTALNKGLHPSDALEYLSTMETMLGKVVEGNSTDQEVDSNIILQYMQKYPDRSREEIIRALQKQGK